MISRDFYVNKLGFPIIRENYRPDKKDWKLDLKLNSTTELEIFAPVDPPTRPSYPEACGLRHLAFHTNNKIKQSKSWKHLAFPANL